jgi:hypothetical protein
VVVYVGQMLLGGVEELTSVAATTVEEIRYLSPSEAQMRFGTRQGGAAVILVTLR